MLGCAATGWAGLTAYRALLGPGPLEQARTLVVPRGGTGEIGDFLAENGAVPDARRFLVAAWATRGEGPLRAAEFAFPAHASLRDVLTVLRTARPMQHLLTIPEGLTARQIAALVEKTDGLTGPVRVPAEGRVLPQTYSFELGATRETILGRASAAMDQALAKAWADRQPDLPLDDPQQALTLASIVERETARVEERPHVAAVFLNRLRQGMKLQADPTVVYAASEGSGAIDRPLTRADLDRDDPYNTYRNKGLPPGPIASPGAASLRAVTQPAASADLYFVADGTGRHVFARSLDEHQRNIARWRAALAPAAAPATAVGATPAPPIPPVPAMQAAPPTAKPPPG